MVKDIELIKMGEGAGEEVNSKPPLRAVPGMGRLLAHSQKGRGKSKENKPQQVAEITRRQDKQERSGVSTPGAGQSSSPFVETAWVLKPQLAWGGLSPAYLSSHVAISPSLPAIITGDLGVGADKDN